MVFVDFLVADVNVAVFLNVAAVALLFVTDHMMNVVVVTLFSLECRQLWIVHNLSINDVPEINVTYVCLFWVLHSCHSPCRHHGRTECFIIVPEFTSTGFDFDSDLVRSSIGSLLNLVHRGCVFAL